MKYISFLFALLFVLSYNGKTNKTKINSFESKIDSLKLFVPTISGNHTFSFAELSENKWEWQKSQNFIKIDSDLWVNYFDKPERLIGHGYYYQTNYYYKILDLQDNFINLIVLQYIHNDNESYMYLLQFDKQGNKFKSHILASIVKSPVDYEEVKSTIQGNEITTYKCYMDEEIIKRDTIKILW